MKIGTKKSISWLPAFILGFCLLATQNASAQSAARLVATLGIPRGAGSGLMAVDVLVIAGTAYVTNNTEYDGGNPNGSWETINLRLVATGATTTGITVSYPGIGFSGTGIANVPAGGCYAGIPALNILVKRAPPAVDAGLAATVVATITYPVGATLSVRGTTTAICAARESFWSNSSAQNGGTRLTVAAP